MKIKLSTLRKMIREAINEQGIERLMLNFAGGAAGGAGLSQPTAHDGGAGGVPPGLGDDSDSELENEKQETYEEEEVPRRG